jgi:hypothetical protein
MIVCRGWSGLRGGEVRVAMLAWPASRGIVIARFLKAAMTCGALAVRAWERSSSKSMSRTQCSRSSIIQWPRMMAASPAGAGLGGGQ